MIPALALIPAIFLGCQAHTGAYEAERARLTAWGEKKDPELVADLAAYSAREDSTIYDQYLLRCLDSAFEMRDNVARVATEGIEVRRDILAVQRGQCVTRCEHIQKATGEGGYAASSDYEKELAKKYLARCRADYEAYDNAKPIYFARRALKSAESCVERPECPYLANELKEAREHLDVWASRRADDPALAEERARLERITEQGKEKLAKIAAYESDPRVAPLRRQIRLLDVEIEAMEKVAEPYELERDARYVELMRSRREAAEELARIRRPFGFGDTLGLF